MYNGIINQSTSNESKKIVGDIEKSILDIKFYNKHKEKIRIFYKEKSLQERYRIKRNLYKSSLSGIKKDEIWRYLNAITEDDL